MAYWKDNADSYICSVCGYECNNPNKLPKGSAECPKCRSKMEIMTNADRIRAMSDKELAKFLYDFFWGRKKQVRLFNLEKWLQQPAEEDDYDERKENEHV